MRRDEPPPPPPPPPLPLFHPLRCTLPWTHRYNHLLHHYILLPLLLSLPSCYLVSLHARARAKGRETCESIFLYAFTESVCLTACVWKQHLIPDICRLHWVTTFIIFLFWKCFPSSTVIFLSGPTVCSLISTWALLSFLEGNFAYLPHSFLTHFLPLHFSEVSLLDFLTITLFFFLF